MKAVVVYESIFGNTEQVARAIAEELDESFEVWAVDVLEADYGMPDQVDLLVVGGPTHMFGMSRGMSRGIARRNVEGVDEAKLTFGVREWLRKLPKGNGRAAIAFDTSIPKTGRMPTGGAARGIASQMKRKGYKLVAEPESFHVEDGYESPLMAGELERARTWAKEIVEREFAALTV